MLHLSGCCWNFFSRFIVAIPRTCAVHKVKYVVMCFGGMYFLLVRTAHFKVWRDQLYHRVQSNGTACSHTASVDDCFLFNLGMALEPFTAKIQRFIWSTSLPPPPGGSCLDEVPMDAFSGWRTWTGAQASLQEKWCLRCLFPCVHCFWVCRHGYCSWVGLFSLFPFKRPSQSYHFVGGGGWSMWKSERKLCEAKF